MQKQDMRDFIWVAAHIYHPTALLGYMCYFRPYLRPIARTPSSLFLPLHSGGGSRSPVPPTPLAISSLLLGVAVWQIRVFNPFMLLSSEVDA